MTDEQWPRVKALFQAAVERPTEERNAFLAAATGDDAVLRREVESLLASDASGVSFLDRLPVASASVVADPLAALPTSMDAAWPHKVLVAGLRVGPYEIVAPLGAGAMGEVYRARDTKLNRTIAVKVLPERFALDPDRLARFTREAQVLATLNHQNIGAIYGLEESNGTPALVLELVDGPTLADRIAVGPIPLEEALTIARQIAEALQAAHEKGIIHRDLKPANIKSTRNGTVKVLDFGLAKVWNGAPHADLSASPRLTVTGIGERTILGTPGYMSPEQARGKALDRRTDIWSFGCVFYEALTGRQAFAGETVSDTLAAILTRDPDWQFVPASLPVTVSRLLQRWLHQASNRRLRDIGEARLEMEEALAGPGTSASGLPAQVAGRGVREDLALPSRQSIPWTLAGGLVLSAALFAGGGIWMASRTPPSAPPPIMRFTVAATATEPLASADRPALILSPDGTRAVYVATSGGTTHLNVRSLDRLEAAPIPGTEGGSSPFFSPDGEWVGFFAEGRLKKVPLRGGPPVSLCDAPQNRGGTWGPDDTIIFVPGFASGLSRVSAAGGAPQIYTKTDSKAGERTHRWPEI